MQIEIGLGRQSKDAMLQLPKIIIDGFDSDAHGSGRLVFIEVTERKIVFSGQLENSLDQLISGCVVAAFEIGNFDSNQVRMPGDKFGRPDLL